MTDTDAIKDTTVRLAWLADRLDERSERATHALEQAAALASSSAQRLDQCGAQLAHDVVQAVGQRAAAALKTATDAALADARQALAAHVQQVQATDRALVLSREAMARHHARWWVIAPGLAVLACAIAMLATAAWVAQARRDVARHRIEADLLHAYNEADVTLCDGRLCARMHPSGTYQRVALRDPSAR